MPWRPPLLKIRRDDTLNSYRVLISEIMLQQTQVDRVIPKYKAFIKAFPTYKRLSDASFRDVLTLWHGLGYNRRALNLKRTAEIITKKYNGKLPQTREELEALPGIGPYTAGALLAFVYNKPVIFIETNIRTVFLHHFFPTKKNVHDKDIFPLIEKTLNTKNPRRWYYTLMDYGAELKRTVGNPNTRSTHYTKQSRFKGSTRELRAKILRLITESPRTQNELIKTLKLSEQKISGPLKTLQKDGLIEKKKRRFHVVETR